MSREAGGRAERDSDTLFGALLFVIALVPRATVALAWAGEPVWDGHYYDFGARRIAAGLGYSDDRSVAGGLVWHPWCHYPVGYSAFLGAFYRVLGASHAVAAVANSLTGAALAVVTWALARHALSKRRARAAGLLVALHPGLILYTALVMTEPLAALLTLAAFWLAVRDSRPARGRVVGALTLGVAALVRPQALLCAPFLAGVVGREPAPERVALRWRQRAVAATSALAIALVPVLPWTARNCRVMDGCALVSTNAGWNLAIGAFPRATGRFETLHASDGCRDVTGQVEQDRCWLQYGLGEIAARPWRWFALMPLKLGFTFDHESFAVEYLHEARPEAWPQATRERAREATTLAHRVLLAAAALGAVAFPLARSPRDARSVATQAGLLAVAAALGLLGLASEAPVFWPLAVFAATIPWLPLPGRPGSPPALLLAVALLATTALTHAVFFGEDRYHIVVTPVLALLAAAALRPAQAAAHVRSGAPSHAPT
ncbi:MAG TPA: glycosyltransferase family 39 protein [Solirubrobacteraceae bacterium]|nr:glycosyltransferase family 39 protein [Solirubrobacteraceae bacterium]